MPERIIITGGNGSLARSVAAFFAESAYAPHILAPSRKELDVTNFAQVKEYFRIHPCDLLIAMAGACDDELLLKTTEQQWDSLIQSNLTGAALCAQQASRAMLKQRRGHIVFISSYAALHPSYGQVAYASAKAGLIGLSKSLAQEFGPANVRVNVLFPGFLENRMTASLSSSRKEEVKSLHCLQRFNTDAEVCAFLEALHFRLPYTSGQIFNLDSRIL